MAAPNGRSGSALILRCTGAKAELEVRSHHQRRAAERDEDRYGVMGTEQDRALAPIGKLPVASGAPSPVVSAVPRTVRYGSTVYHLTDIARVLPALATGTERDGATLARVG